MFAFFINRDISIAGKTLKKGNVYPSTYQLNINLAKEIYEYSVKHKDKSINKSVIFFDTSEIFKKALPGEKFKNLIIFRYGGIGDLIALTSIVDYFEDKQVYFVTQEKYFPLFDWFEIRPKLIATNKPIFTKFKFSNNLSNWAEFNGNGVVEAGEKSNWFEVFFGMSCLKVGAEYFRPSLKTERITDRESNIQILGTGKPSLLICNKATAMMRTAKASTIIDCIPDKGKYDIFVHEINLAPGEKVNAIVIPPCSYADFFLDVFDADKVISVDTGALHFREGVEKPAIGIYNSFTTESRTKYYQYTKSYDIKSDCDLQPCFLHENEKLKHCPKGNSFDAPCLSHEFNVSLKEQLTEIFKDL